MKDAVSPEPPAAHHQTPPVETAFVIEQMRQTAETFRTSMISVVTLCTVLGLINASLVGYAVNQRLAGLLLAGPLFPAAMFTVTVMVRRMITPMIYTAINIEHRFGGTAIDWLSTSYASAMFGARYVDRVLEISHMPDRAERMRAVAANPLPFAGTGRGMLRALVAIMALGQPVAAIVLWQGYGWQLF